jgi:hypothetical protein
MLPMLTWKKPNKHTKFVSQIKQVSNKIKISRLENGK